MIEISETKSGSIILIRDGLMARFPDIENFLLYVQAEKAFVVAVDDWLTEREAKRPQVPKIIKEAFGNG